MQIVTLNGARMTSKRDTHLYLAQTLRFPVYYGRNLDALHDCLTEFCGDTLVILRNVPVMRAALGDYGDALIAVFEDAAEASGMRFFIDPA
ncbi:MAG: barstar family protein [Clostridia bacterium]|nr:barstar family protein [Clostridia bacterium]